MRDQSAMTAIPGLAVRRRSRRPVLAIAMPIALGACGEPAAPGSTAGLPPSVTGADTSAEPSTTSSQPTEPDSPPSAAATIQESGRVADRPAPAGPAAADLWTREDFLAQRAEGWGIEDPPEVDLVREVHPDEVGETMRTCMADYGFNIEVDFNGGWGGPIPVGQEDLWYETAYVCMAKYPLMSVFYQPYDDATLQRIYDYLSTDVATCFADNGAPVTMPTYQTFRAQYDYDRTIAGAFVDAGHLWEACPINIPHDVIYPR